MALIPFRAMATSEPPSTAVTTSGQSLAVEIASPVSPARVEAPGNLIVQGSATIGAPQSSPLNAAFVVDLSGSTGSSTAYDCNGNGLTDVGDDFNASGGGYGQLVDCEIAGLLAVNNALSSRGNTDTAIVGFSQGAAIADMQSVDGDQVFTPAANDSAPPVPGDVETVARSLQTNVGSASIEQYTKRAGLGSSGQYQPALRELHTALTSQPDSEERVAFFMADGAPSDGNAYTTEMSAITGAHIKINTFALGVASGGCGIGTALGAIASATGGSCVNVANPAAFTSVIAQGATIAAVEYSVNGGPFAPVTSFNPATGAFDLTLPVTLGSHTLRVRARAADGTLAQAMLDVTGIDRPDVLPSVLSTAEGSSLAVPGLASDLDTPDADLAFAWTPNDGLLSPTNTEDTVFQAADNGLFGYTLTATDPDGLSGSAATSISVTNVAPTIDTVTAPALVNEGEETAFDVVFSDPGSGDSHTVTFAWGDGTPDTILTVDERATSHTAHAVHTYAAGSADPTLVVTVADDDGGVQANQQIVDINHGPTAALDQDAYSVVEGGSVAIAATFADVDNNDLTADLTIDGAALAAGPVASGSGFGVVVGSPHTDDDSTHAIAAGASDGLGLTGSDTATLTVLNAAPVLGAVTAPASTLPDTTVTVAASFTDAGVLDTHTATVDWGDGTIVPVATSGGGLSADHAYSAFGTYDGTVQVCDDDGGCAVKPFTIAVGTPPTANAGDDVTVGEGSVITMAGSATDADTVDGQALTYHWTPANDGMLIGGDTLSPTFYAVNQGVYTYTLEVCDSQGACSTDSVNVTVENGPPVFVSLTPSEDRAAGLVHVDASWSDPGIADPFQLQINWGDGGPIETTAYEAGVVQARVSHAYGAPGTYTIAAKLIDDGGAFAEQATQLGVVLNQAPVANANAGGPYSVPEGGSLQLTGTASDPNGDGVGVVWNAAPNFSSGRTTLTPMFAAGDGSGAGTSVPVSLVATDDLGAQTTSNAVVNVLNVAPAISDVVGPSGPMPVNSSATIDVSFTDPSPTDTHTVGFAWDDGTTSTVDVVAGVRTASTSHPYAAAGVNKVTITVTDSDGASTSTIFEYVVAYDPTAGFVTGAGTINSPPGAYPADAAATGKASFGIASKYLRGSTVPSGETEFQFKAVGFEFKSTSNDYLVISGSKATYRGVGAVNGVGGYGFQVTTIDGAKTGSADKLRIKIWNKNQGNAVVYDNEIFSLDGADPTTVIATGSIVIHRA